MDTPRELGVDDSIPGTKYIVVRRLSGGGHGTIYLVRNRDLPAEKRFALKILNSNLSNNADLTRRLLGEAHLQASIEHPNVVAVYDAGMTEESPPRAYLLMERLRGHSLQSAIRQAGPSGLGLASIYGICIQVCDALECAHEKGAIHRDIKPDNVFIHTGLNEDSVAVTKVLDFGVAYFMGKVDRRTGEVVIGTPMYMSPEQFRGERPTARTDLYAVGLLLYELVTGGKRPFSGENLGELAKAHLYAPAPKPSSKVDFEIPQSLEALIMELLAKEPSARPTSARAVGSRLREMKAKAEVEYSRGPVDETRKTQETPLDNLLMMSRGADTAPTTAQAHGSDHQTLPGTPNAKADPASLDRTQEDLAVGFQSTLRSNGQSVQEAASAPPPSPVPIRMAVTRTLEPSPTPVSVTDTPKLVELEPLPSVVKVGDRWVAVSDGDADDSGARLRPAAGVRALGTTTGIALGMTRNPTSPRSTRIGFVSVTIALIAAPALTYFGVRSLSGRDGRASEALRAEELSAPASVSAPTTRVNDAGVEGGPNSP